MARRNVFVSFDHDDQRQVGGFRSLKTNPDHPLEFNDHSIKEPVLGGTGKPIKYPPDDPRSKPVRDEILKKFDRCTKLVVLIGDGTYTSAWVAWEVNTFHGLKKMLSGENTWRRIRGMRLKGSEGATIPAALLGQSTEVMNWNPEALDVWIDKDPDAQ
jgi:hypothetical protein